MTDHAQPDGPAIVDLAREPDFELGAAHVRPSLGEVATSRGSVRLQPRVMQVLVALAQAGGEVVSRDALVARCWGGLAIGEDAIQRCIGRLRRLAESEAPGAFAIETLARIGYRLTAAARPNAAAPAPSTGLAKPRLAVLAFDNRCDGPQMDWFCDGVSEEILQTVARSSELNVIGRASSFQFRGAEKGAASVAAALGVTHVLDGTVRRSGGTVRISAQLVECAGQTILWSDRFDRELVDIFALQDEIARAVAGALEVAFAAPTAAPIDPAVYDLYLRARTIMVEGGGGPAARSEAFRLLEQVVAAAPGFARGWSALAVEQAWWLRFGDGARSYGLTHSAAEHAAQMALSLDPGAGLAWVALSYLEPLGAYQVRESLHEKALAASPNDPEVLSFHSRFCQVVGRNHEAAEFAARAFQRDPLDPRIAAQHAGALAAADRYAEDPGIWDGLCRRWPHAPIVGFYTAFWTAVHQDWPRFRSLAGDVLEENRVTPWAAESLITPLTKLAADDRSYWLTLLASARTELNGSGTVQLQTIALLHAAGLVEESFDLVDRASFAHLLDRGGANASTGVSAGVIFWPLNKAMMRDHRFVDLCAKLGLCDYWMLTDRWPDCADAVGYDFRAECRRTAV